MKKIFSVLAVIGISILTINSSQAADVYLRKTTVATPLASTGGVRTNVLSVNVPAGNWIVTAKTSIVNWANKDYDRCRIMVGATQLDASTTMTGEFDFDPAVATITTQGAITTPVTRTFSLQCWHDFNVGGQYVDPGASLLVVRALGPLG
jgi:hypothetical protein